MCVECFFLCSKPKTNNKYGGRTLQPSLLAGKIWRRRFVWPQRIHHQLLHRLIANSPVVVLLHLLLLHQFECRQLRKQSCLTSDQDKMTQCSKLLTNDRKLPIPLDLKCPDCPFQAKNPESFKTHK